MTLALCFACGAEKHGAFNQCRECGHIPPNAEERAKSMLLSDHHLNRTSLTDVSATLRSGQKVNFPEESLRDIASSMPSDQEMEDQFQRWKREGRQFKRWLYMFSIGTVVVVACVAIACWAAGEPTAEEYAVYTALLSERWAGEGKPSFVIKRETADTSHWGEFGHTADFLKKEFEGRGAAISLEDDLIESFSRIHDSSVRLDSKSLKVPNATIVPSTEITQVFQSDGPLENSWAMFRARFGGAWGIITLSRVGFSADGSRALLSVSDTCGPLCGSGDYVLLEKTEGKWRIVASIRAWIS